MQAKLRHAGIVVRNMQRSIDFYCKVFGFAICVDQVEQGRHIDAFLGLECVEVRTVKMSLGDQGPMLELLDFHSHNGIDEAEKKIYSHGISHIAITVEDIGLVCNRLAKDGLPITSEPIKSPDNKVLLTFAKDPDGNFLEIVEELQTC